MTDDEENTNRQVVSGGVKLEAENDVTIGHDVAGRDMITESTTNIFNTDTRITRGLLLLLGIFAIGILTVLALVVLSNAGSSSLQQQSSTRASPTAIPSVIGRQAYDIFLDPDFSKETEMGNMIADALRLKYSNVEAALINSGVMRAHLLCLPPSAGERSCEITEDEIRAVLPYDNRTIIETLSGEQLSKALVNGFSSDCDPNSQATKFRFPQVSGLRVEYTCNAGTPEILGLWRMPNGSTHAPIPIKPSDSIRLVTSNYLYSGGDGYTILGQGTDINPANDSLLDIVSEYIKSHSPVAPKVEGRIIYTP